MRALIAEDDPVSRHFLEAFLVKWGYEVVAVTDGTAAERELRSDDAPRLAILDWMMPGINGIDICREVRRAGGRTLYLHSVRDGKGPEGGCPAGARSWGRRLLDQAL